MKPRNDEALAGGAAQGSKDHKKADTLSIADHEVERNALAHPLPRLAAGHWGPWGAE